MGGIFLFVINRKSVRLTAGILDASRVETVGGEVANLGNDTLRTDIDVLGVASALVGHQIRTDVERELRRVGASTRELGVHVELFTLTGGLHRAFTVGIIPVVGHEAVVIGSRQAVLLVPAELALGCGGIQCAILLDAACIDIDQVAVGIVSIGMVVVHLCHGIRILFRAVVRILHFGQMELFALSLAVGIGIVNNRLLSGQKTK